MHLEEFHHRRGLRTSGRSALFGALTERASVARTRTGAKYARKPAARNAAKYRESMRDCSSILRKWRCSDRAQITEGYFGCAAQRDDRRGRLLDASPVETQPARPARLAERQAQPERHLAGAQHRELRHPVAQRARRRWRSARARRAGAGRRRGGVRRRRRRARAAWASSRATRFRTCPRRRRSSWRTRRTGSIAIRRSSATSPACRAPTTCRSRSRSCTATRPSSSRTSTPARCATST